MFLRKVIAITLVSTGTAWGGLSKLEALSLIETGNDDGAIGGAGEVSRYQIKPWVWRIYSKNEAYRNRTVSSRVAERYLTELEDVFRKRTGRQPEDFDLYVLWNAGPTYYGKVGFSRTRVHSVIRQRALRFVNLRRIPEIKPPAIDATARPSVEALEETARKGEVPWIESAAVAPMTNLDPNPVSFGIPITVGPENSAIAGLPSMTWSGNN